MEKAPAEFKPIIKKASKLRMHNPSQPRIKCLLKIHIESNEVKEIIGVGEFVTDSKYCEVTPERNQKVKPKNRKAGNGKQQGSHRQT